MIKKKSKKEFVEIEGVLIEKISKKEFIQRCDWEGGQLAAGFQYGINADFLNDDDPIFKEQIRMAHEAWVKFAELESINIEAYRDDWEEMM